jgi:hypothetical protein
VLALFLLLAALILFIVFVMLGVAGLRIRFGLFARGAFGLLAILLLLRRALLAFALALLLVVFKSLEDEMQPRHHLVDRRQLTWGPHLAARALWAGSALRAVRPCFAARSGLALRALFAALALRADLSLRAGFAARTFGARAARMALRSGTTRFARASARTFGSLSW